MYYKKIDEFIAGLDKDNIEELKPQLRKYMGQLMMSIKDEDNNISFEDMDGLISMFLIKEEFRENMEAELEAQNSKFGLLSDEFMKSYGEFVREIVENGYIHNAIDLTRNVLGAIGGIYRDVLLMRKQRESTEERCKYMQSEQYLDDLLQQINKHLEQYNRGISREYFIILGLVNYIKSELRERLDEIGNTFLSELKSKSLDDFNKEDHISEYNAIFNKTYINELQRRIYSWNILSFKLQDGYYIDELYKELE